MYRWRRLTPTQRKELLQHRRQHCQPWHSPPHCTSDSGVYMLTAACFEHRPIIGLTPERMAQFELDLLARCRAHCDAVFAWTVLPNHYHALLKTHDIHALLAEIGRLHGRTSYNWNGEEDSRGRQVWCRTAETGMKSDRHFCASLLYVFNNPVRHGYVEKWQDWPYTNVREWLASIGRKRAAELWEQYPIDRYGDEWDPPEL